MSITRKQISLASIDPGYGKKAKGCATAVFREGELHWVGTIDPMRNARDSTLERLAHLDLVIVEIPQMDARSWGVPPEVLIRLTQDGCLLAGALAGISRCVVSAQTPTDWKGSIEKPIVHAALWELLDADERKLLGGKRVGDTIDRAVEKGALARWNKPGVAFYPSTFTKHNELDAVAIGMTTLLGRKLV